jgi:hypothetical protein
MTPSVHEYAVQHGYCANGDVSIQGEVQGDCGSAHIDTWDEQGTSGRMRAGYGFRSTLGAVVYRSLRAGWTNLSSNTTGSSSDTSIMASSLYATTKTISTGNGRVFATLSGNVTLIWGGICTIGQPSDTTVVYSS